MLIPAANPLPLGTGGGVAKGMDTYTPTYTLKTCDHHTVMSHKPVMNPTLKEVLHILSHAIPLSLRA